MNVTTPRSSVAITPSPMLVKRDAEPFFALLDLRGVLLAQSHFMQNEVRQQD